MSFPSAWVLDTVSASANTRPEVPVILINVTVFSPANTALISKSADYKQNAQHNLLILVKWFGV